MLQGKSELKLESASRAFLLAGKMTARVPEEAIGFIVNTPQGAIVDLGTEFALSVSDTHVTEVHVLEGEVEATGLHSSEIKHLKENQGG